MQGGGSDSARAAAQAALEKAQADLALKAAGGWEGQGPGGRGCNMAAEFNLLGSWRMFALDLNLSLRKRGWRDREA